MLRRLLAPLALPCALALSAFAAGGGGVPSTPHLAPVATSPHTIWNGVTVSGKGRIFVNYPSITPRPHPSVAELDAHGTAHPYPNAAWNRWTPGHPAGQSFIGTNAVRIGPDGDLWVVDTGSPSFGAPVLHDAAKIVCIDLRLNQVKRIYPLGDDVVRPQSYIDDIRFHDGIAYLTDAGVPGILVLDLATGQTRRVLDHDPSTTGLKPITVDGQQLLGPDNQPLLLHADQMEVSPDGRWLYFQPLPGPLYRVATADLNNPALTPGELSRRVELWYQTGSLGGSTIDADGNLYLELLDSDSILRLTPDRKATTVLHDPRLHWADAPWIHNGFLYLPVAQIDRAPQFHHGHSLIHWPLDLYRIPVADLKPKK